VVSSSGPRGAARRERGRPGWPRRPSGLAYGGDYTPEQWPEEMWVEDARLMRDCGVNLVTVGVFAWGLLEPKEGQYDFDWLDRVIDLLHGAGVSIDLATGTASPPPWFSRAYPDSLPRLVDGTTMWPGSRQAFCPSSPDYREAAVRLVGALAKHYAGHPALAMWHIHNEYGCHNAYCYCDTTAAAFRGWLVRRYGDLDTLNDAWSTSFWSQRYYDWEEILPPRTTPTFGNPGQQLDFARFSSDELLDCYLAERETLRGITPDVPVTTNFMDFFKPIDYWSWASELDVVSNDHYLRHYVPEPHVHLSMAADLTRSLAGGAPWLLMEHSTSAVNWQPVNYAKRPGEMRRNSLAHIARGADGALFFQWRASRGGAEKFHSGLLPHAGVETKVYTEARELGRSLRSLGDVKGSRVEADVAILFGWPSWWAGELPAHPTTEPRVLDQVLETYTALWHSGVTTDFAHPGADLSAYRLVLAPSLYLVSDEDASRLERYVDAGGTLVVGFFSGIADEHDEVRLGGYPGAFRQLLGVRIEEFFPLRPGTTVPLSDGSTGSLWSELGAATDAEVVAAYADGPVAGSPAVTVRRHGAGRAWYVGTRLIPDDLTALLTRLVTEAGVSRHDPPSEVEVVRRRRHDESYLFVINHSDQPATVAGSGVDLLTGRTHDGRVRVEAGDVVVVRERADDGAGG